MWITRSLIIAAVAISFALVATSSDDLQGIRDTLAAILDEDEFESEMLDFQDQTHHFIKTKRTDDSVAVMKVANAQALISATSYAIRGKSIEICSKLLDDYSNQEQVQDMNEARLLVARALLRTKVTILQATTDLWQQTHKFIKQYGDANGMDELIGQVSVKLNKDHLTIAPELKEQERALERFSKSEIVDDKSLVQSVDQILDDAFECQECSTLADNAWSISPLGTDEMIFEWIKELINEHYFDELQKSVAHIAGLLKGSDEQPAIGLEQIEADLR